MMNGTPGRRVPLALLLPAAAAVAVLLLAGLMLAPVVVYAEEGGGQSIGGEVPSTLSLGLGEPTTMPFTRTGAHGQNGGLYTATVPIEVTATDAPVRLSITDGEAIRGKRHGHLVDGASILAAPLQAAAGDGPFASLNAPLDPLLARWGSPLAATPVVIRLRQRVRGGRRSGLRGFHKLLLITLTAAGP